MWSVSMANSFGTKRSRTARHASFWRWPEFARSAGSLRSRCEKASRKRTNGSSLTGRNDRWQPTYASYSPHTSVAPKDFWGVDPRKLSGLTAWGPMKKLRVGVVGVGHIGSNHARLYAE